MDLSSVYLFLPRWIVGTNVRQDEVSVELEVVSMEEVIRDWKQVHEPLFIPFVRRFQNSNVIDSCDFVKVSFPFLDCSYWLTMSSNFSLESTTIKPNIYLYK